MMLLALLSLLAVANARRRHSHSSSSSSEDSCTMSEEREDQLLAAFSIPTSEPTTATTTTMDDSTTMDGTTATTAAEPVTLYCRLKAHKRFPHWTDGCPDPTDAPTTQAPTTTTAAPTTTTAAPTTTTTVTKTEKPPVDVVLLDAEDDDGPGIRRLLRRGRGGHGGRRDDARTAFTVSAGQFTGFKNKGGCRDESSFTCFDDLSETDCAYTDISVTSVDYDTDTVILTFTSRADSDGVTQTIDLVCPFEGRVQGDDCTAPEAEIIECRHQEYVYGRPRDFDLECSTVESTWTTRDGTEYPACPLNALK